MRIISGTARGRKLHAPDGNETRPTADRVRESLFNIIQAHVRDARVLDIFAGTGALALEAISRGAECAVLIDNSPDAVRVMRKNIEALRCEAKTNVIACDWKTALSRIKQTCFTIVFIDPPYHMESAYCEVMEALNVMNLIDNETLFILELSANRDIRLPDMFCRHDKRRYGDTEIIIARRKCSEVTS